MKIALMVDISPTGNGPSQCQHGLGADEMGYPAIRVRFARSDSTGKLRYVDLTCERCSMTLPCLVFDVPQVFDMGGSAIPWLEQDKARMADLKRQIEQLQSARKELRALAAQEDEQSAR
jgi:hypothetical protein